MRSIIESYGYRQRDGVSAGEAVPVIVRRIGQDHALVLGPSGVVDLFGVAEHPAAAGSLTSLRSAAVTAPLLESVAGDLSGGLVRLSQESQGLLARHGPTLAQEGGVLGVVRGADGRFAGMLTFEDAGNLATLGASLPVLVSAMALQAQLSVIERKLDELQADVSEIIRDGQIELVAEFRAVLDVLEDVHSDVSDTGVLTDDDWARVSGIEVAVRTFHHQTRAQLADLVDALGDAELGLGARVRKVAAAARNDRVRFWFQTHVVADVALTRWESLRLERLAQHDDSRLAREAEGIRASLEERRSFTESFAHHLGEYVGRASRLDGLLDRLRFIKRARLESLILELEAVLGTYRAWVPVPPSLEEPEADRALPATGDDGFDWDSLVADVRRHAATPVHRVGRAAGDAARVLRSQSSRVSEVVRDKVNKAKDR